MSFDALKVSVGDLAGTFAAERSERIQRRHLDEADFAALGEAGLWRIGLPAERGGLFTTIPESIRPVCETLRILARGDGCVALVSAMHPAVLIYWLGAGPAPDPHAQAWEDQRSQIFDGVDAGEIWGTVTSEPGSGGDILKTKATAVQASDGYRISGDKHFGSGSGISKYMLTTAMPAGEELPDVFYVSIKDTDWDGSSGVTLTADWDAHGMIATQSHAFRFDDYPATRVAWPGMVAEFAPRAGGFANALFVAVVMGVFDVAMEAASAMLSRRLESLRSFEANEWTRAQNEYWTALQVYEGILAAVEHKDLYLPDTIRAKIVIAELAESALTRVAKASGGGAYTRKSPLGQWTQDVRALGFLRPPWGLGFDQLLALEIAARDAANGA